jgi:4a-hydroxytetrahydrobiopterin dehydratase
MRPVLTRQQLIVRKCRPITDERPFSESEILAQLLELPSWRYNADSLERGFAFRDYYHTIAFVNALAWMVHGDDHHPVLTVEYNRCTVRWNTHSIQGISENDFTAAAKTDALFARNGVTA